MIRAKLAQAGESDWLLCFSVRDTGIGIPEGKIGLLFNKFAQVDTSTTRKFGGTGLGLAISRQLVELMGGRIGVESQQGKGSEFWFTVRLGKSNEPEPSPANSQVLANLNGVRVLIVDDNATSREMLTTLTAGWGMRPTDVESGPLALEALLRAREEHAHSALRSSIFICPDGRRDARLRHQSRQGPGRYANGDVDLSGRLAWQAER